MYSHFEGEETGNTTLFLMSETVIFSVEGYVVNLSSLIAQAASGTTTCLCHWRAQAAIDTSRQVDAVVLQ